MNPALDVSAAAAAVVPTEKVRCHASRRDPGGGGINVARVIERLGGKVEAIYPAGGPAGQILCNLLARQGIKSQLIAIAGETREDITILDEGAGRQYRFILPGPELSEAEWQTCLQAVEKAPPGLACASGSLPPGIPNDFYARFASTANRAGQKAFLDTSGDALREALKAPLFLIKPNLEELAGLVDDELTNETAQLKACRAVLARSKLEAIALTLGPQGALLVTRKNAYRARSSSVQPLSTVGAGDSFMGALIWALAAEMEWAEALRVAVAAGTAAVLTEGTELCHAADVHRLGGQITVGELELSAG
jgi:6-phosphofructokinase 2